MNLKKRLFFISCLVLGICSILVGTVAYYSTVVSGSLTATAGTAIFVLKDSDNTTWNNKVISLNSGNKVNPGDSGSFIVKMDATGSDVDMYATLEIDRTDLPTNLKFYTTSDKRSELHKYYSLLETTNQVETLTIYWYWNPYIDDVEDSKFINKSNLSATIMVSAIQVSEYAVMKNGNGTTSSARSEFWQDTYRPYISTITFGSDLSNLPSSCTSTNLCWDVSNSSTQNRKVYGYLVDSGEVVSNSNVLYDLNIVSEAPIFAPSDCTLFFAGFNSLESINFNNNFNTSKVTNMSYMFAGLTESDWSSEVTLTSYNKEVKPTLLSNTNEVKVELMAADTEPINFLTALNLESFNTSKVTDMSSMFYCCESLTSIDLSSFNTSKVTNMSEMFTWCIALKNLDLSSFNTSNVTDMSYMITGCRSLTSIDLSSFNTSNVTNMHSMFYNCKLLTSIDLSSFNTSKVTNMSEMFTRCTALKNLDLSSFNTSNVTDMSSMFYNCESLTSIDLSSFNTSNVTSMSMMFYDCESLTTEINIMSNGVTNYSYMFYNAATASGAKITVNYIADASTLVDNMIATKLSYCNVVKGSQL